jgi:putative spermidine/putrescine transport system permease protein
MQFLIMLPLVAPGVIMAIGMFYLFARLGLLNTVTGLVMAHTALAIPFVTVTVLAGLQGVDGDLRRAASTLGASPRQAVFLVVLPQIRASITAGAIFAFVSSLDEVVVSLFISGGETATLTRRMFSSLRDQVDPTIAAVSTLLIVISLVVVGGTALMQPRART